MLSRIDTSERKVGRQDRAAEEIKMQCSQPGMASWREDDQSQALAQADDAGRPPAHTLL